jgi:hypothetical protein
VEDRNANAPAGKGITMLEPNYEPEHNGYCENCADEKADDDPMFCEKCRSEMVAICGCGYFYDKPFFEELDLIGHLDDGVDILELRNCHCNSTISAVIGKSKKGEQS